MSPNDNRVAVIGGGISGLTTAILLQTSGYRTFLYTRKRPSLEPDIIREPEFASLHAAASVIPHSVSSPSVAGWTSVSQRFFNALSFRANCGVRTQLHYEIFESSKMPRPVYADAVRNFAMLSDADLKSNAVPHRHDAAQLSGWNFDVFFAEVPEYMRYLYGLYEASGGRVVPPDQVPDESLFPYLSLNYKYYVNCTGSSAPAFLENAERHAGFDARFFDDPEEEAPRGRYERLRDPAPPKLIRGHYLRVDIKQIVTDRSGRFFSYNYVPDTQLYSTASGGPADVYCYPRSDAWILGGSRQEGRLNEEGVWEGESTLGDELTFRRDEDGEELAVPAPIFDLNAELLYNMTGGELDLKKRYNKERSIISPGFGYRFVRDAEDGVRLSISRLRDKSSDAPADDFKYVVHNYGHGGSGFTLSWGCAFDVLRLLDAASNRSSHVEIQPHRRKFVLGHASTTLILADLIGRLIDERRHG